jgi:type VI secretion system ImpB/VipA family protein
MSESTAGQRFRIAVLAPLTPRKPYATSGKPAMRAYVADGGAVDSLLSQIGVSLKLEVADPLGPAGAHVRVDLRLSELRSFRPDALVEQVAALRALAQVRGLLRDLGRKNASRSEAVAELQRVLPVPEWAEVLAQGIGGAGGGAKPWAPPPPAASPAKKASAIDSLLDQVDVDGAPSEDRSGASATPSPKASGFSALIAQVAAGGGSSRTGGANQGTDRAERAFRSLLSSILEHPELHRLERAWRSVRFLLAEAKSPVDLEVIPIDESTLTEGILFLAERPADVSPPPDLIVLDTDVELTEAGLRTLEAAGLLGDRLRAPVLVGGSVRDLLDDEDATRALKNVAASEWASWVTLAYNGGLLRSAYTAESSRVRDPKFAQDAASPAANVFARAPYLVAALCARSFREIGWPSAIVGPEAGVLTGFDVHAGAGGHAFATEKLVSVEACKKQARRGLLALTSVPNRDAVVCAVAPTLAAATDRGAPTLPDQLFAARFAAAVAQLGTAIPSGTDAKAAEEVSAIALADLFPKHGATPTLQVHVKEGALVVTIHPRRFAGTSIGELTLEAPLEG